jgi:hypothetical protein
MTTYARARRSTRLSLEVSVMLASIGPGIEFSESCKTVAVSCDGCGLIASRPLEPGVAVLLTLATTRKEITGKIVDVISMGQPEDGWLLGIEFDVPANVWGIECPPSDWVGAVAPQPTSLINPTSPPKANTIGASISRGPTEAMPAPTETGAVAANNSHPFAGLHASQQQLRNRDWENLRNQVQQHTRDLMGKLERQFEDRLSNAHDQLAELVARVEAVQRQVLDAEHTKLQIANSAAFPSSENGPSDQSPSAPIDIPRENAKADVSEDSLQASDIGPNEQRDRDSVQARLAELEREIAEIKDHLRNMVAPVRKSTPRVRRRVANAQK